MRRPISLFVAGLFAFVLLASSSLAAAAPVAAATPGPTTTCSNGVDNTGGLGLICEVTIVNTITPSGGSARVTIRECHGAAGDPTAACTTTTTNLTGRVSAVTQCNDSINGGGGTLRCSVRVTNRFIGVNPNRTAATVNQCVGSGSITTGCDPFPATTSGATITQCNGSAGGGTLVQLTCSATGTKSSSHGVRINQCNGSANGGGALVICSASVSNLIISSGTTPGGTTPGGTTTGGGSQVTPPPTITAQLPAKPTETDPLVVVWLVFLFALSLVMAFRHYRNRWDLR